MGRPLFSRLPDAATLRGRRFLITGAGGSIARAILRQILPLQPAMVGLLDHHDSALYEVMRTCQAAGCAVTPVLGSVADDHTIADALTSVQPDVIIHAAAYKIVPLVEHQVVAATAVNCCAAHNLFTLAGEAGVSQVVFISSYEAYEPKNVFGLTKRVAELSMAAAARRYPRTDYRAIRYSLVLFSTGSVALLFEQLARQGAPLTITDLDVERYVCTLGEAACATLSCLDTAQSGEILTLDMGHPLKMVELARRIIADTQSQSEIVVTGMRPGDKLHESPLGGELGLTATRVPGLYVTQTPGCPDETFATRYTELFNAIRGREPTRVNPILQLMAISDRVQS
ncbi:MAG TPA: polysaccharide biosynthesis protein [Herpetosiphonaceae bacterium]|nr:polysaccharide biosynthesis protein [Herpetosiphonaceae bacterium]